jgi:hypothetical protein
VALWDEVTFWVGYGHLFAPLCLVVSGLLVVMRQRRWS